MRRRGAPGHAAGSLALLLVAVVLGGLVGLTSPASADDDPTTVPTPTEGSVWFGPSLDWSQDLPADYAERLGRTPSLYTQLVDYPLTERSGTFLEQFAEQAATQGAGAVLTLEPTVPLAQLGLDDAEELGRRLAELHDAHDSFFLVRFAPEMNGSWNEWGQQPDAFVEAFREVATAVRDATEHAQMVWSPVYGAGYPYGAAFGDVAPGELRTLSDLDTDGDGVVDERDDPYGPYWPGRDVVDWVGLTLYHFGDDQGRIDNQLEVDSGGDTAADDLGGEGFATNVVPGPAAVQERWDERYGYAESIGRESFYERFAEGEQLPLLLETGALWQPPEADAEPTGDPEARIKQEWWRQVLASLDDHPRVAAISWLEQRRPEAEAGDEVVDWRATRTESLASSFRDDLEAAGITLGPLTRVLDQEAANAATAQGRLPGDQYGPEGGDELGWIVFCASVLALAFGLSGLVGRLLPSWRYPDKHDPRDRRLDLFRGFIIVTVVLTHVELGGPYSFVSLKAVGAITGAEMFVMLSGVVLGMIYEPTVRKLGEWGTAVTMWRRARKQYVVALVVVLLVYALGWVPFVDTGAVSTFTDRGTGQDGVAVAGQVYDLYANGDQLLEYPPPWFAVRELLLLQMGPWVFNIMGLFVVLSLLLPLFMVLVRRGLWWVLLAGSWAGYLYGTSTGAQLLPSQFEDVFPFLIWQLPFTHGLVLGYYRARIVSALTSRRGVLLTSAAIALYVGTLVWIWWGHRSGFAPWPFPATAYDWLYANGYTRVFLQFGRLLDLPLVIVCAYAVLTRCWKPIDKVIGWFWIPLGQASLYVFIVHVFFAIAVAQVPGLDRTSWWQGLLLHTLVLLAIWELVRRRVLFSVIPR